MSDRNPPGTIKAVYGINDVPPLSKSVPLSLQHLFAMFSGNILCPILVAGLLTLPMAEKSFLIQCSLFSAGVATIIQVRRFWRIGSGLPIVMGTSNAFVPTVLGIASRYGIGAVIATSFVGGLFEMLIGFALPKLRKLFSPLVLGIVILTIGITLIPVGVKQAAGGAFPASARSLFLSGLVIVSIIIFNQYFKGLVQASAILFGMLVGFVAAVLLGAVDFSPVSQASWLSFPSPLRYEWSVPWDALAAMLMMYVVTAAETMGDASAITMGGEGREATHREVEGSVLADGAGSAVAAIFNGFPNTSYSQNVGVVSLTGVMSRHVVFLCAIFLVALSLFPKLSALIAVMPMPVLGGASVVLFSMVAASGFVVLRSVPFTRRNLLIIAVALGLSVGLNARPDTLGILPDELKLIFAETGVATATLVSIVLDRLLPKDKASGD